MTDDPLGDLPPSSTPQTLVGGYEIIARLGEGAMGTAYKARQVSMDRIVALKVLKPELATDRSFIDRFLREARAAAQLNHPNIVQAFDAGNADGYSYFAMEYVDGHSLQDLLKSAGSLTESRALEMVRDIALALDCAHAAGVIHRDVKPDNILVAADGTAKLADLGIAHRASGPGTGLTQAGQTLGTPDYISPEQIRGEVDIDGRTDIYSLAATLYHMLAGHPPFHGSTNAEVMSMHLTQPPPNVRDAVPHISARTGALIKRAMAKSPGDRHATAREFAADLDMLISGTSPAVAFKPEPAPASPRAPVTATPKAPVPATARPRTPRVPVRRHAAAFPTGKAVAVAVIAVFALLGIYLLVGGGGSGRADQEEARKLAAARQWVAENPGQYQRGIIKYEHLRNTLTKPEQRSEIDAAIAALKAGQSKAADAAFAKAQKRAGQLSSSGGYIEAIKTYRAIPREFRGHLSARINRGIAAAETEAAEKAKPVIEKAKALLDEGDPTAGLAELEKISDMQHPTLAGRIDSLRETLMDASAKQVLAARKRANGVLESLNALAAKGQLAAAARTAHAAALEPALSCIKSSADALSRIGDSLLKASSAPKKPLAAQTPDEHIAAALLALAAEDTARMEASVGRAGDHDFTNHYATKLEELKERLQQREADKRQQQQERLLEFRSTLASGLKRRRYEPLIAELDTIIASPDFALIKKEAEADCRALSKLAVLLQSIRANVRAEADKQRKTSIRYRGIPTTVKAYNRETDKVTFGSGQSQTITSMRAADLKALLDLRKRSPDDDHIEALALLALGDGDPAKARSLLASLTDRGNVQHLMRVLGTAAIAAPVAPDANNGADDGDDTPAVTLTDEQKAALEEKLATNRDLFNSRCATINQERDSRKTVYREQVAWTWSKACSRVRDIQQSIASVKSDMLRPPTRSYSYYSYRSYYRRNYQAELTKLQGRLVTAARAKAEIAEKIRKELGTISKRAEAVKSRLRTVMLRHKRLMLSGKDISEDEMITAFENALSGIR